MTLSLKIEITHPNQPWNKWYYFSAQYLAWGGSKWILEYTFLPWKSDWNKFPGEVVESASLEVFRRHLEVTPGDMVMVVLGEWLDSMLLELSPNPDDSVICYIFINASTSKEKASGEERICKANSRVTSCLEQPFGICTIPHSSEGSAVQALFAPTPSCRAKLGVSRAKIGLSPINGL